MCTLVKSEPTRWHSLPYLLAIEPASKTYVHLQKSHKILFKYFYAEQLLKKQPFI